jgi:hypothetical protein
MQKKPPPEVPEKGKRGKAKATKGKRTYLSDCKNINRLCWRLLFTSMFPLPTMKRKRALRPAKIKIKVAGLLPYKGRITVVCPYFRLRGLPHVNMTEMYLPNSVLLFPGKLSLLSSTPPK